LEESKNSAAREKTQKAPEERVAPVVTMTERKEGIMGGGRQNRGLNAETEERGRCSPKRRVLIKGGEDRSENYLGAGSAC